MKNKKVLAIFITLAATALAGCGEEGDFKKAINTKISKNTMCYGFSKENNAKVFDDFRLGNPVKVNIYNNEQDPILTGLKDAGILEISYEQEMFKTVALLTTTEKGRKTSFWDRNNGACMGHRSVDEITNWTEPCDNGGQKVTQVTYTWKLADIPGWVDKKIFAEAGVTGIDEAKQSKIVLVKTNNGWQAAGL